MSSRAKRSKAATRLIPGWETLPHTPDDGPGSRAAIGLIALANDMAIEPELGTFLPRNAVGLYTNRIPMSKVATVDSLGAMERDITATTEGLVPDDHLDVVAFGCTSGTMTIGADTVAEKIRKAKPGIACTDPVSASLKGLRALGCTKIALITPYIDQVNAVVENYVSTQGFDIGVKGSFKQRGDPQICRIPPQAMYDAGEKLGKQDVDALFISCTAVRVSGIIQPLEEALGKPVVTSNQALAWDCLRQAGYTDPVTGFGKLLTI